MARLKSRHSALRTLSCKFGGIGKHTPLSPGGAEDMCNFRILPGGILQTRSGYQLKKIFPTGQNLRGVWQGTLGGVSFMFAVAGNQIYRLNEDTLEESSVGDISEGKDIVHFCVYMDNLYVLDGKSIYHYLEALNRFFEVEPYVPLYGYQWHPSSYGEVYEEFNLLSPRLRVHYYNSDATNVFKLPYYPASIDVVRINGRESSKFIFASGSNQITTTTDTPPVTVEIGFRVNVNEEVRQKMLAAQLSYIYSHNGESKLMLWGNDARVFCSKTVTDYMLASCHALYPTAASLYFCADDVLFLGDSSHPVTAICPMYDTLLAFTTDRIWNIAFGKEGIELKLATPRVGCASPLGVIPYQNDVIAVMENDIYRISASVARPEQLTFERLSKGLGGKVSSDFSERAHLVWNIAESEIWIRDPQNETGDVWIWNTESDEWYRFDNICAAFFFKTDDGFGFAQNNGLFLFNKSYTTDSNMPIAAFYRSAYFDFGTPDIPRRSMRAYLHYLPSEGNSSVLFETERSGKLFDLIPSLSNADTRLQELRLGAYRYRFLRFTIYANAATPAEFYRLDIHSLP